MFRRPNIRYGKTAEPETPYQRAGQVWDERIGSARVQAKNWRLAFFAALALSGGLGGGLVWQSARSTITPWVVQVDKLGQAQTVAPATADYRPTDPEIAWHLARFITEVRGIPADPVVLRAVLTPDPPRPVRIVELPRLLPLPGQLKPIPGAKRAPWEPADPHARIDQANGA